MFRYSGLRLFVLLGCLALPAAAGWGADLAGKPVSQEEIMSRLRRALGNETGNGSVDIQLTGAKPAMFVPAGAAATVRVDGLDYNRRSGRFTAMLAAPANDPDAKLVQVSGRVQSVDQIPVLRNRIVPGETIGKGDIDWVDVRGQVASNMITDANDLIGQSPKRPLMPGVAIRSGDIGKPEQVLKGATVTMNVISPGMVLSASGRAIGGGSTGDTIQVMNLQTKRTIEATVVGPNRVEVSSRTPHVLSN